MRADISIDSMVVILVSVVAAGMLISLAFGKLPELSQRLSCSAHRVMASIIPASSGSSPSLPEYCSPQRQKTTTLEKSKSETVEQLAAYVLGCWEKGEHGSLQTVITCDQVSIDSPSPFSITPEDITSVFISNGLCNSDGIQSNITGCGAKNQIDWQKANITNKDFILFEYVPGKVVVR